MNEILIVEMEVRRMLEDTNLRHLQIEKMTKEAAIRHNQVFHF